MPPPPQTFRFLCLHYPDEAPSVLSAMAWWDDDARTDARTVSDRMSKRHSMGAGGPKRDSCSCASDEPPARHASAGHLFEEESTSRGAERASGGGFPNLESSSGGSSKTSANPEPPEETLTLGTLRPPSTCVEPDHRELIRSVSVVLHRRIRDNEDAESKLLLPLFCEDTHTEAPPEPEYEVSMPTLPVQALTLTLTSHPNPNPHSHPHPHPHPDPNPNQDEAELCFDEFVSVIVRCCASPTLTLTVATLTTPCCYTVLTGMVAMP